MKWFVMLLLSPCLCYETDRPHIVFVIADDLGYNDVSLHGSDQIQTPNIDALAYDGTVLTNYYSEAICTPTRSALLTGQYPIRTGMQGFPLYNAEDRALPLRSKLLPQFFKEQGYATHAVGKWHAGMARREHLPLQRGFDSHVGFHGGFVDYYEYNKFEQWPNGKELTGYDWFRNNRPDYGVKGYMTDVLTEEAVCIIEKTNKTVPLFLYLAHGAPHAGNDGTLLQAPPEAVRANGHIADTRRRYYAGMVTTLDTSIGHIVKALEKKKMLDNTIIIFMSDNGAPSVGMYNNWGSNLPFRGIKTTPWEGGVKVPALVWSKNLKGAKAWPGLMHVTDWLPTLLRAVNGDVPDGLDGVDQWEGIACDAESNRNEMLVMMDDFSDYYAYRLGNYKLVAGKLSAAFNDYYTADLMQEVRRPTPYLQALERSSTYQVLKRNGRKINLSEVEKLRSRYGVRQVETRKRDRLCVPDVFKFCLYDIERDPKEQYDIAKENPQIVMTILGKLLHYYGEMVPRGPLNIDSRADPANFNYTWIPWLEDHKQRGINDPKEQYERKMRDPKEKYDIAKENPQILKKILGKLEDHR